jgi:hypothetical protein
MIHHGIDHPALAQGLISITASLEVVGLLTQEAVPGVLSDLRRLWASELQPPPPVQRDVAFVHDHDISSQDAKTLNRADLETLWATYEKAAKRPVHMRATHLALSTFECKTGHPERAVALSLGSSFFPDEGMALALRVDVADDAAWPELLAQRSKLVSLLGDAFWWSTTGYRFRLNPEHTAKAGAQQAPLSMRLMGVDWDDPFGGFTTMSAYGLRSINWQTLVADAALQEWLADKKQDLPPATRQELGHHLWQTGKNPSLGDREKGIKAELLEYALMGKDLYELCQHHDSDWFGDKTFKPWAFRWRALPTRRAPKAG